MSFIHQTRHKIVMQLLTINADVLVPYNKIIDSFWGNTAFANPSPGYMAKIISDVRKILPYGKIEHVHGEGYIYRPTLEQRSKNFPRVVGKKVIDGKKL